MNVCLPALACWPSASVASWSRCSLSCSTIIVCMSSRYVPLRHGHLAKNHLCKLQLQFKQGATKAVYWPDNVQLEVCMVMWSMWHNEFCILGMQNDINKCMLY